MVVDCIDINLGGVPAYMWRDGNVEDRAIALTMHGLMMHGRTFDTFACKLASRGLIVVAPDLRGFGHWHFSAEEKEESGVDYRKSLNDLIGLIENLVRAYSSLPLFCVGESLGAHLARKLVVMHPDMISGLILSSL